MLTVSCEYGNSLGSARSCLCRLRRHIRRTVMSTSRANPTAAIAMPTLAPVLRPLEPLEGAIPVAFTPLVTDDEVVELRAV